MNSEFSRFDELVSRYLDAELTQGEAAELVSLLGDPTLAKRFLQTTRLNSEIAGLLAAPVPDAAMADLVRSDIEETVARERVGDGAHLNIVEPAQPSRPQPPRRKLTWQRLAWAAVFILFAGFAVVLLIGRERLGGAPRIVSVQGEVRLIGSAGEHALTLSDRWRSDEHLKTVGSNRAATLTFRDGSQLAFGADTSAVNQLKHGVVQAVVQKQPSGRPFVVATPQAEAIVVGTSLRLVVESHSTRLEVAEGKVRFRRRSDGAEVIVSPGQYASVAPNVPLVCCIWEDGQIFKNGKAEGDPALYRAVSIDNGATWSKPERITFVNAPKGWATHSKSYADGSRVHLAWTDAPDGPNETRATYYMSSPDGGRTWEQPERLTLTSDGEWCAVAGTDRYAVALMSAGDQIKYSRRDFTTSHGNLHHH